MCMLKHLFQQLQITPLVSLQNIFLHKSSWLLGKQLTSWGTAKDYHLGTSGSTWAFVFQGETDDHLPLGTAKCPGQECCSFFPPILPEFQSPHHTLFTPVIKGLAWKEKGRWFVRV